MEIDSSFMVSESRKSREKERDQKKMNRKRAVRLPTGMMRNLPDYLNCFLGTNLET